MQKKQPQSASCQTKEIQTFPEFLSQMTPSNGMDYVLFRGHERKDYKLLPKIARCPYCEPGRWQLLKEKEMLTNFKDHAIGMLGPGARFYNDWEWLALAQHYGMATKYLDWTKNPLVALWFSVAGPLDPKQDRAVWKLERKRFPHVPDTSNGCLFENKPGAIKFFEPSHVTTRIRVQAGVFTVHYGDPDRNGYVPLEDLTQGTNFKSLTKYIIPSSKVYGFRKELNQLGVNALSLFPDVEHICEYVNWLSTLPRAKRDDIASYRPA